MSIDFSEAVDLIYSGQHQKVAPETFQTIGTALLLNERGTSVEAISQELNLSPQETRELLISASMKELERQQKEKVKQKRRYPRGQA